jgi:hypothetical protein
MRTIEHDGKPYIRVSDLMFWTEALLNSLPKTVESGQFTKEQADAINTVMVMESVSLALSVGLDIPDELGDPEFVQAMQQNLDKLTGDIQFIESLSGLDPDDLNELSKVSPETLGQDTGDN